MGGKSESSAGTVLAVIKMNPKRLILQFQHFGAVEISHINRENRPLGENNYFFNAEELQNAASSTAEK